MSCAICSVDLCHHGRITVMDGKPYCNDCGKERWTGEVNCLPMYEGEVDYQSDVCFTVCDECYSKHSLD